jgi:hypothetical protein
MLVVLSSMMMTSMIAMKNSKQYMRPKTTRQLKSDLNMSDFTEPLWQVFQTCVNATSINISW